MPPPVAFGWKPSHDHLTTTHQALIEVFLARDGEIHKKIFGQRIITQFLVKIWQDLGPKPRPKISTPQMVLIERENGTPGYFRVPIVWVGEIL